jgi:hypothetical protein
MRERESSRKYDNHVEESTRKRPEAEMVIAERDGVPVVLRKRWNIGSTIKMKSWVRQ